MLYILNMYHKIHGMFCSFLIVGVRNIRVIQDGQGWDENAYKSLRTELYLSISVDMCNCLDSPSYPVQLN